MSCVVLGVTIPTPLPPSPRQSDSQPNGCNVGQEQQDKNAQPEYNPLLVNHSVKKVVAHLF